MVAGESYDASDPTLVAARARARRLTARYNATSQEDGDERRALLMSCSKRSATERGSSRRSSAITAGTSRSETVPS